jgi:isoleucyl-tRNA synthetase
VEVSQGKRVQYTPGWDCHGLPIEVKALQALKKGHGSLTPVGVRAVARSFAEKTIEEQKSGFKNWAVMGDWDHAYKTMDSKYELRQLEVFKAMAESGTSTLNKMQYSRRVKCRRSDVSKD